jgi:hypothetical protein
MTDEIHRVIAGLTEAQKWALHAIAEGYGAAPNVLGQRMMERPGATERPANSPYKSQGYGRMGAGMMKRLADKGLIVTAGWPTHARLTRDGLAVRARLQERSNG